MTHVNAITLTIEALETAHDTIAAFEPLLPTQKLIEHGKWERKRIREALTALRALRDAVPDGVLDSLYRLQKHTETCRISLVEQKKLADMEALMKLNSEPLWPKLRIEELDRVVASMDGAFQAAKLLSEATGRG